MKKQIHFLVLLLSIAIIQSCVKDRVPNPDSLNVPETIVFSENFDSNIDMPTGWSAPGTGGWSVDTAAANSSSGYAGATGKGNAVISNPTVGGGTFNMDSKGISTKGFNNIKIIYGARRSKHYSDNGSTITLAWSIDDGNTWNTLPYQENTNDSNWYLINGGTRISLPAAAANQPNLKIRWAANTNATPSGTYRIDDFQVFGAAM